MRLVQRVSLIVLLLTLAFLSIGGVVGRPSDLVVELTWEGAADLDLVVTAPSGYRVSYLTPSISGGTLIADSNRFCAPSPDSQELVVFPWREQPTGEFFVTINYALACGMESEPVRWRLTIRSGEEVVEKSGEVMPGESLPVGRFVRS